MGMDKNSGDLAWVIQATSTPLRSLPSQPRWRKTPKPASIARAELQLKKNGDQWRDCWRNSACMDEDLINLLSNETIKRRCNESDRITVTTKPKRKMKTMIMKTNRNVHTLLKTILYMTTAALLFTTAVAAPAAAATKVVEVPFKGIVEGFEDFNFKADGSGINVPGSGRGNATHLGRFTATWDGDITFTNPDNLHPTERAFIAANGVDKLYAEGFASGTPPVDGFQFVTETMTIIGGMGRFEGASGSFNVERGVFDIAPPFTNLPTFGSFNGTISLVTLLGDCNADGVVDGADLACVGTIEDRDVVLGELNTLPGDLDGDGEVAFADFLELSNNFGKDPASYPEGNIDLAEGVGFADFLILSNNFGQTTAASSVPEPTGFAMLSVMGLLGSLLRRPRR